MSAFEELQQNPFYLQQAAQASIAQYTPQGGDYYQPHSFAEVAAEREGAGRTIQPPVRQPLNTVREGRMPSNAYFPPSLLRQFGLDPSAQRYNAPTRRRRWNNAPGTFVVPQPQAEARPGFKRVINWQEYQQDKVHEQMGRTRDRIGFRGPMIGYTQAPVVYRELTTEELAANPWAHTLVEDNL